MASLYFANDDQRWIASYSRPDGRRKKLRFTSREDGLAHLAEMGLTVGFRGSRRTRTVSEVRDYISNNVQVDANGCWLWQKRINSDGYSQFGWKSPEGQLGHGHRVSYRIFKGPIAKGLHIDHLCRVRHCVNPDHLEAVTPMENVYASGLTLAVINGTKTHCPQGHAYSPENTYLSGPRMTWRQCRTCGVKGAQERYARIKKEKATA